MRWKTIAATCAGALALGAGTAGAAAHMELGAHLAGMGQHGVVNITVKAHDLCWTFDLPATHATAASIRDTHGMVVAKLGSKYTAKACGMVAAKALALVDATPSKYWIWVDTKGHPGELRGKLFAGMAHM
jgi:hypothetical protein